MLSSWNIEFALLLQRFNVAIRTFHVQQYAAIILYRQIFMMMLMLMCMIISCNQLIQQNCRVTAIQCSSTLPSTKTDCIFHISTLFMFYVYLVMLLLKSLPRHLPFCTFIHAISTHWTFKNSITDREHISWWDAMGEHWNALNAC